MSTIKQKIQEMASGMNEVKPEEFFNLILDDLDIGAFNADDKKYLEEFVNMETLALNGCKIKSLAHFPNTPKLVRVRIIRALLNVRIV